MKTAAKIMLKKLFSKKFPILRNSAFKRSTFFFMDSKAMINDPVEFASYAGNLKEVPRTGWTRYPEIKKVESVSDHSYRMGLLAMLFSSDKSIDSAKLMKIALLHDLAESEVGDITPYDGVSIEDKFNRENTAIKKIFSNLPPDQAEAFYALWLEYEQGSTPEGLIVKDIDKYEMMLQAYQYEGKYPDVDLTEFFKSSEKIKTPAVKQWTEALLKRREEQRKK